RGREGWREMLCPCFLLSLFSLLVSSCVFPSWSIVLSLSSLVVFFSHPPLLLLLLLVLLVLLVSELGKAREETAKAVADADALAEKMAELSAGKKTRRRRRKEEEEGEKKKGREDGLILAV